MSELRQDIVSGDWIILATGRAARPKFLDEKKKARKHSPKSTCPFEHIETNGNWPPIIAYPNTEKWEIVLIPNKYPAVASTGQSAVEVQHGIYHSRAAVGTHAILIGRDHVKGFPDVSKETATNMFEVLQSFHVMMGRNPETAYVSSFCNWGPAAGASISHPHYQSLTLPIIPPHTAHSLEGAKSYFKKNGRCVRCDIIKTERAKKVRIIAETKHAIAFAPYASAKAFEVNVMPRAHWSSFGETPLPVVREMAELLQAVLRNLRDNVNDPDLNFFIHDAPVDGKDYRYHHWHIEVVPVNVTSPPGGFEVSTAVNINVIDPDNAAAILRGQKVW